MIQHDHERRFLLWAVTLFPVATILRPAPAQAQSEQALPPIVQPAEKTKAAFLARARELRDQAAREGDQAYGAVVVRDASSSAREGTTLSCRATRPPTPSCSQCAKQRGVSTHATSPIATCTQLRRRVRCVRAPCIGRASDASTLRTLRRPAVLPDWDAKWRPKVAYSVRVAGSFDGGGLSLVARALAGASFGGRCRRQAHWRAGKIKVTLNRAGAPIFGWPIG